MSLWSYLGGEAFVSDDKNSVLKYNRTEGALVQELVWNPRRCNVYTRVQAVLCQSDGEYGLLLHDRENHAQTVL